VLPAALNQHVALLPVGIENNHLACVVVEGVHEALLVDGPGPSGLARCPTIVSVLKSYLSSCSCPRRPGALRHAVVHDTARALVTADF